MPLAVFSFYNTTVVGGKWKQLLDHLETINKVAVTFYRGPQLGQYEFSLLHKGESIINYCFSVIIFLQVLRDETNHQTYLVFLRIMVVTREWKVAWFTSQ